MTAQDITDLGYAAPNPTGAVVATDLERAGLVAVAGLDLNPSEPVTVGLGDSFVGGFLAGLHRSGGRVHSPTERPANRRTSRPVVSDTWN